MKRDLPFSPMRPLGLVPTKSPEGLAFDPDGDGGGDMFRVGDRVLFAINGGKYPGTVTEVRGGKEEGIFVHFDSGFTQHMKPNMYSRLSFDDNETSLTNIYGALDVGDRFFVKLSEWEAGKFGTIESIGKMGAVIRIEEHLYSIESVDYDLLEPLTGPG